MLYKPQEEGQGLVEYALILMLIALVLIAIVALFGDEVIAIYSRIVSELPSI